MIVFLKELVKSKSYIYKKLICINKYIIELSYREEFVDMKYNLFNDTLQIT